MFTTKSLPSKRKKFSNLNMIQEEQILFKKPNMTNTFVRGKQARVGPSSGSYHYVGKKQEHIKHYSQFTFLGFTNMLQYNSVVTSPVYR